MITGLYAGLLAFGLITLILKIVKRRMKYQVAFGDGNNEELLRHRSAHGNFIETVPFAILLMAISEFGGASPWLIQIMGLFILSGRVMHFFGITRGKGYGKLRKYGMICTLLTYVFGAITAIYMFAV